MLGETHQRTRERRQLTVVLRSMICWLPPPSLKYLPASFSKSSKALLLGSQLRELAITFIAVRFRNYIRDDNVSVFGSQLCFVNSNIIIQFHCGEIEGVKLLNGSLILQRFHRHLEETLRYIETSCVWWSDCSITVGKFADSSSWIVLWSIEAGRWKLREFSKNGRERNSVQREHIFMFLGKG